MSAGRRMGLLESPTSGMHIIETAYLGNADPEVRVYTLRLRPVADMRHLDDAGLLQTLDHSRVDNVAEWPDWKRFRRQYTDAERQALLDGCQHLRRRPGAGIEWCLADGYCAASGARATWTASLEDDLRHAAQTGTKAAMGVVVTRLRQLDEAARAAARGCGRDDRMIDWSALPTVGPAPSDTSEVWTWTPHYLVTGTCAADLCVVPRALGA